MTISIHMTWLPTHCIAKHMCCWNHEILIKFKLKIRIRVAKYVHFVHCCFLQNLYCQLLVHFLQCLVYNMIPMPVQGDSPLTITIQSVDNLRQRATALPGKYKAAHQLGQLQKRSVLPLSSAIKYFFTLIKYFSLLSNIFCSEDMRSALRATSALCPSPPLSPLSTLCKVRAAASTNVAWSAMQINVQMYCQQCTTCANVVY